MSHAGDTGPSTRRSLANHPTHLKEQGKGVLGGGAEPWDNPAMAHAHGHGHSHGAHEPLGPASRRVRLVLGVVVGVLFVTMAVALAVLWPHADTRKLSGTTNVAVDYLDATVTGVQAVPCGPMSCEAVRAELASGPLAGSVVDLATVSYTHLRAHET